MNLGFQYSQSKEVVIGSTLERINENIVPYSRSLVEKQTKKQTNKCFRSKSRDWFCLINPITFRILFYLNIIPTFTRFCLYLDNFCFNTGCRTYFIMLLHKQSWAHKGNGRRLMSNFVVSKEEKEKGKLL